MPSKNQHNRLIYFTLIITIFIIIIVQYLSLQMIIEHVHQNTFNKRKLLDLINYEISRKQEKLIDLKIQASILEDRLKFDIFKRLPAEMTAATITGKVQDAILKREAAIVVQHSYRAILDVMKKDHDYMFQVNYI